MKKHLGKHHTSIFKSLMISIHKMGKLSSSIFIGLISLIFVGGCTLVLTGLAVSETKNFNNAISISGIVLLTIALITVTLFALGGNYGGRLIKGDINDTK